MRFYQIYVEYLAFNLESSVIHCLYSIIQCRHLRYLSIIDVLCSEVVDNYSTLGVGVEGELNVILGAGWVGLIGLVTLRFLFTVLHPVNYSTTLHTTALHSQSSKHQNHSIKLTIVSILSSDENKFAIYISYIFFLVYRTTF